MTLQFEVWHESFGCRLTCVALAIGRAWELEALETPSKELRHNAQDLAPLRTRLNPKLDEPMHSSAATNQRWGLKALGGGEEAVGGEFALTGPQLTYAEVGRENDR